MNDDAFDLSPAPRRVLTDDVVDAIRGAILSGKIRPGSRLIEEDLAAPPAAVRRRFVSEDLAGLYEGPGTAATNKRVRDQLRRSNTRPRA